MEGLGARKYEEIAGKEAVTKVLELAGTKMSYWRGFCTSHKRPGSDLARRLVEASMKVTPGVHLSLDQLLIPDHEIRGRAQ